MVLLATDVVAAGAFFLYLLCSAGLIALTDRLTNTPREWIRKSYHIMIAISMLVLVYAFSTWTGAVVTLAGLMLFARFVISVAYRLHFLQDLAIDRKSGSAEVTRQIGYLTLSYSGLIVVFWGILGPEWRFIAVLVSLIWGFGDAAAALVGKFLGKHQLREPFFDPKKTVEGALANFIASGLTSFVVLQVFSSVAWWVAVVCALLLAGMSTIIEAASRDGRDTIILPWSLAALAYPVLLALTSIEKWWLTV